MSKHARIRFESAGLHGTRYALAVAAAVLLQLGLYLTWFGAIWRVKTAPRTYVPMWTAYPELYYFGITIGLVGGVAMAAFVLIATFRWLRGIQFTLAELLALVLAVSVALFRCVTQAALSQASYATTLLYPLLYKFVPSAVPNFSWQGSPGFNSALNLLHLSVLAVFLLGLWGRIPSRFKVVKLGMLAAMLLLHFTCGNFMLFSIAPALALPVVLVCGLATRDPIAEVPKLVATFKQPVFPRCSKLPRRTSPLAQNS